MNLDDVLYLLLWLYGCCTVCYVLFVLFGSSFLPIFSCCIFALFKVSSDVVTPYIPPKKGDFVFLKPQNASPNTPNHEYKSPFYLKIDEKYALFG